MTKARLNCGTASGLVTAAILGIAIISQPIPAHAAHGGGGFHGGGFHGGGFHGGGFHGGFHRGGFPGAALGLGLGLAAAPFAFGYGYPYYGSYAYYGGDCYLVPRRVWTPWGWRFRRVQVCD